MVGDETFLALRTVLCSDEHSAHFLKQLLLQYILSSTGTEKECRFNAHSLKLLAEVEQRSYAHATTNEQHLLRSIGRHGERIAQRQNTVKKVALLELLESLGAFAYGSYEQPQFIGIVIDVVDRNRTTEECRR